MAPMTTRSQFRVSSTALPSLKNSGFETTETSTLLITSIIFFTDPIGIVDLLTKTEPVFKQSLISRITEYTVDVFTEPSEPWGVGRQINTKSRSLIAAMLSGKALNLPFSTPSKINSERPFSNIGDIPLLIRSTFAVSTSARETSCPIEAKHAAVVNPT